tara:strand:+ start:438 stop:908 length:471 start_codon:yes stop_codon:yes gene_type:complete
MKTLKQIMSESDYTNPKAQADKDFVDKHVIQKTDYPHTPKGGSNDEVFSGKKQKKKKRIADPEDGDDKKVYESKKKEDIVKGMKANSADFIKKLAQTEAVQIDMVWDLEASVEEIKSLKQIHETLSDSNKKEFEQRLETPEGLKKMIEFATNLVGV